MAIKGASGPAGAVHVTLYSCAVCASRFLVVAHGEDCISELDQGLDDHATTIYPCAVRDVARYLARTACAGFWAYDRSSCVQEGVLL